MSTAFTVTDLFCGCGGSTTGAAAVPGVEVRQAFNHWERAIETHSANHPETEAVRSDLLDVHPACFSPMTALLASPECRTHSPGAGTRRKNLQQGEIFDRCDLSPETIRSRATMWTVTQWASVHRPQFVIVENVVEIHYWPELDDWFREMQTLGYEWQRVYVNAMHVHGFTDARVTFRAPQSRDRIYVVFWKRGNPAPDLSIRPLAPCPGCAAEVQGVQVWKNGRTWGKYRRQYAYACPRCAATVEPYVYPASTAIDWTLPSVRIGDRAEQGKKPLSDKTRARIAYGLRRYGLRPLTVSTRYSSGVGCRVRSAAEPMPTVPTQPATGLVVETAFSHSGDDRVRPDGAVLPTQTVRNTQALVYANRTNGTLRSADEAMHTVTTGTTLGLLTPLRTNGRAVPTDAAPLGTVTAGGQHHGLVTTHRGRSMSHPASEPLTTVTAHTVNHGLVTGAQVTLRGTRSLDGLDEPLGTVIASAQQIGMVTLEPAPFLVSYYGTDNASGADDPIPTVTTRDRHALVEPGDEASERIDDLYFRMFEPDELKVGTGYAPDYQLVGTKRDQVRLVGGSNYSGIEQLLLQRCLDTLDA